MNDKEIHLGLLSIFPCSCHFCFRYQGEFALNLLWKRIYICSMIFLNNQGTNTSPLGLPGTTGPAAAAVPAAAVPAAAVEPAAPVEPPATLEPA